MQSVPITTNVVSSNTVRLRQGLFDTTLCEKVCHWIAAGRWFSPCTQVSPTNKTDSHGITEILWKVESGVKHHNSKPYKSIGLGCVKFLMNDLMVIKQLNYTISYLEVHLFNHMLQICNIDLIFFSFLTPLSAIFQLYHGDQF